MIGAEVDSLVQFVVDCAACYVRFIFEWWQCSILGYYCCVNCFPVGFARFHQIESWFLVSRVMDYCDMVRAFIMFQSGLDNAGSIFNHSWRWTIFFLFVESKLNGSVLCVVLHISFLCVEA